MGLEEEEEVEDPEMDNYPDFEDLSFYLWQLGKLRS